MSDDRRTGRNWMQELENASSWVNCGDELDSHRESEYDFSEQGMESAHGGSWLADEGWYESRDAHETSTAEDHVQTEMPANKATVHISYGVWDLTRDNRHVHLPNCAVSSVCG